MTPFDLFMSHVEPQADGCWYWTGSRNWVGHGTWRSDGRGSTAHRFAYEFMVGTIPSGLVVDHLCRVRHCVNPAHLEPVTQAENLRRAPTAQATINAAKTHCKRGHEFTSENTRIFPGSGSRSCKTCETARRMARAS